MTKLITLISILLFLMPSYTIVIAADEVDQNLQDAQEFRLFLKDLINACRPENDQVLKIKETLISHPLIFQWFVVNKDFKSIIKNSDLYGLSDNIDNEINQLQNIATSLKNNIDRLNLILHASHQDQEPIGDLKEKMKKDISFWVINLPDHEKMKILGMIPDFYYLELSQQLNQYIRDLKFSQSPSVQLLLDDNQGIDFKDAPQEVKELFGLILTKYYDELPYDQKKTILLALLDVPSDTPFEEKLSIILTHSGPALQKAFQLIGKDVRSPFIVKVMERLKHHIAPFPLNELIPIIEKELNDSIDTFFADINPEPIGSATIGQVHLATLASSNKKVVIKIRKPGVAKKAKEEIIFFRNLTDDPKLLKIIDRISESLEEELDFTYEAENLFNGEIYNDSYYRIKSVKAVAGFTPTKRLLIMKLAKGKMLHSINKQSSYLTGEQLLSLLEIWLDEALFGGGFFHGDLHSGNMFLKIKKEVYDENEDLKSFLTAEEGAYWIAPSYIEYPVGELTIIDFGNAGYLDPIEQKAIIKLILGIQFSSSKAIIDAISMIDENTRTDEMEFDFDDSDFALKLILEDATLTNNQKMSKVFELALKSGMDLPKNLLLFNRGHSFLEKQLNQINTQLEEISPGYKLDFEKMYRNLFIKRLGIDLAAQAFCLRSGDNAKLSFSTIYQLIYDYFCSESSKKSSAY